MLYLRKITILFESKRISTFPISPDNIEGSNGSKHGCGQTQKAGARLPNFYGRGNKECTHLKQDLFFCLSQLLVHVGMLLLGVN